MDGLRRVDRLFDLLQDHRFWLFDVVPSGMYPFTVLGPPVMGFSSITMPEVTLELEAVKQVNSVFPRRAYSGGDVSTVTLQRGVRAWDDSFWEWMHRAIKGSDMVNRHLLLLQYTGFGGDPGDLPVDAWEGAALAPGKAWLLMDCLPVRYKGGSDLDARSGQVSIAELEVQPWAVAEMSLMDPAAAGITVASSL